MQDTGDFGYRDADERELESFLRHQREAEKGDLDGCYALGMCYFTGLGVEVDEAEGWKWLVKAAKRGHAGAVFHLCKHFEEVPAPYCRAADAVKWLTRVADKGDGYALYLLGKAYEDGVLAPKDERQAFRCYQRAVKKGEDLARGSLACCYLYGRGVGQDVQRGIDRLIDTALDGYLDAYYALGRAYLDGEVVPRNEKQAVHWLREAAKHGYKDSADILLGMGVDVSNEPAVAPLELLFRQGEKLLVNLDDKDGQKEGLRLITQAAEAGHSKSAMLLGDLCWYGGVEGTDPGMAEKWWLQVAEDPHYRGQVDERLLRVYLERESTPENDAKIVRHARIAAEDDRSYGMYILGCCVMQGRGMERNLEEAAKWLVNALEKRELRAAAPLFEIHCQTNGSLKETRQALYWLNHAAERGTVDAQAALAKHMMAQPGASSKSRALKWYKKAAQAGSAEAQFFLGTYYLDAAGGCIDFEAAGKWLSLAAGQGHAGAAELLARHGIPCAAPAPHANGDASL